MDIYFLQLQKCTIDIIKYIYIIEIVDFDFHS